MAYGFNPQYSRTLSLDGLTPERFLIIALETAKKLNWNTAFINKTGFFAYTGTSMTSWGEEIELNISWEKTTIKSKCVGMQVVDWGKNQKNIRNFESVFHQTKNLITDQQIEQKTTDLKLYFIHCKEDGSNQSPPTSNKKNSNFLFVFKPVKGYIFTPLLININILIFILMIINGANAFLPEADHLIHWGANYKPITLKGEWWRLFTSCFIHIGVIHLLMNMYALLYIGLLLEPLLGTKRFTIAYIVSGLAASITSLWWNDLVISAGASGAIFGLYGVFLAMLSTNLIDKAERKALLASIGIFVAYNLIYGMKEGIDNAAHIGGLVSGILIGYSFFPSFKKTEFPTLKYASMGIVFGLILSASLIIYTNIPNDLSDYDEQMEKFSKMEEKALKIYELPEFTTKETILATIKDSGLYYWNENLTLLKKLDQKNLPQQFDIQNKKLIRYCQLRINSYQLIYKSIYEDTDKYRDSIDMYHQKIDSIINSVFP
jgi:rhomboid protease GluP